MPGGQVMPHMQLQAGKCVGLCISPDSCSVAQLCKVDVPSCVLLRWAKVAVQCCAVLRCAVLCSAVQCSAALRHSVPLQIFVRNAGMQTRAMVSHWLPPG